MTTTPTFAAGTVRRLFNGLTVTLGEIREITGHPSGTKFDGPAVVVAAWTNSIYGISRQAGHIPTGAFVKLVSLSDPAGREVTKLIAATLP